MQVLHLFHLMDRSSLSFVSTVSGQRTISGSQVRMGRIPARFGPRSCVRATLTPRGPRMDNVCFTVATVERSKVVICGERKSPPSFPPKQTAAFGAFAWLRREE